MLTSDEKRFFDEELVLHEGEYLAGANPRQQSGFGRDERDWGALSSAVCRAG